MTIVVPMAGLGNRFVIAGYKEPKPLIPVCGKSILERVVAMFPPDYPFVMICNEQHFIHTDLPDMVKKLKPEARLVAMPCHKLGPVYTVKAAYDYIPDDQPVVVAYCDVVAKFDPQDFADFVQRSNLDGCLFTHIGFHPHTLSTTTKMAFCKTQGDAVLEVKEKACYTDNPFQEHASSGLYYFRSGAMLKKYCELAMARNLQYNGEFYITLVYNAMVQDGLRVGYYDTDIAILGTPEEVQNCEAWQHIIRSVPNEEDAVRSYRYWQNFRL